MMKTLHILIAIFINVTSSGNILRTQGIERAINFVPNWSRETSNYKPSTNFCMSFNIFIKDILISNASININSIPHHPKI